MANQVTVTAKIGPASQMTSVVLTNATLLSVDFAGQTVTVNSDKGQTIYDLFGVATVTYTVSGHQATVAMS